MVNNLSLNFLNNNLFKSKKKKVKKYKKESKLNNTLNLKLNKITDNLVNVCNKILFKLN